MALPVVGCVTGLAIEARIARRAGLLAEAAGGAGAGAGERAAEALVARGATALVSFGIAGGLDPALRAGAVVVGSAVVGEGWRSETQEGWMAALASRLPGAVLGPILGVDESLALAAQKARAHETWSAVAVDMESIAAARIASGQGLPLAVVRVIVDPAWTDLPTAARYDESGVRPGAVLKALAGRPGEIPALLTLAGRAAVALWALARCAGILAATPPT